VENVHLASRLHAKQCGSVRQFAKLNKELLFCFQKRSMNPRLRVAMMGQAVAIDVQNILSFSDLRI
jgi:hypothetical protein